MRLLMVFVQLLVSGCTITGKAFVECEKHPIKSGISVEVEKRLLR